MFDSQEILYFGKTEGEKRVKAEGTWPKVETKSGTSEINIFLGSCVMEEASANDDRLTFKTPSSILIKVSYLRQRQPPMERIS